MARGCARAARGRGDTANGSDFDRGGRGFTTIRRQNPKVVAGRRKGQESYAGIPTSAGPGAPRPPSDDDADAAIRVLLDFAIFLGGFGLCRFFEVFWT